MMFAKTFCQPGSYIEVVPVGLLATLRYNKNGLLEKIIVGIDPEDESTLLEKDQFTQFAKVVPATIPLSGGTTWISGVFYSENIPTSSGHIPDCLYDDYISDAFNGTEFTFYAGHVKSLAASFAGSLAVRNWLSVAKFTVLPGIVVPVDFTEDTLDMMMKSGAYKFTYPYIAAYMIFDATSYKYAYTDLYQDTVKRVETSISSGGYVKSDVYFDDTDRVINGLNYSEIIRGDIQKGDCILYEADGSRVVAVRDSMSKTSQLDRTFTCPVCGKKYAVPIDGLVQCDDPHCMSTQYSFCTKMLEGLKLPILEFSQYKEAVDAKDILCVTDVLSLPQYNETRPKVSLSEALFASVPVEVCADSSLFEKFAVACNQSVETVMYYAQNPQRIHVDLNLSDSLILRRFVGWLQDPYNVSTLQTVLTAVDVVAPEKKFEGAPIFRNAHFAITGRFKRGTHSDISSILQSYAAEIDQEIEPTTSLLIVGSTLENIDGSMIKEAKQRGLETVGEDEFFERYDIDKDLASNLL